MAISNDEEQQKMDDAISSVEPQCCLSHSWIALLILQSLSLRITRVIGFNLSVEWTRISSEEKSKRD